MLGYLAKNIVFGVIVAAVLGFLGVAGIAGVGILGIAGAGLAIVAAALGGGIYLLVTLL